MSSIGEDAALVVFSNPVRNRSNDTDYDYRQNSDMLYLTGFAEPESVMVLVPGHDEHRYVLFLRERDPKHEIWDGERVGVERAAERVGCDKAFAIKDLDTELPKLLAGRSDLYYGLGRDTDQDQQLVKAMKRAQFAGRRGVRSPTGSSCRTACCTRCASSSRRPRSRPCAPLAASARRATCAACR